VSLVWLVLHSQSLGGKPWIVSTCRVGGVLTTRLEGVGAAETAEVIARTEKRILVSCILRI
jgi:hypothetical protein